MSTRKTIKSAPAKAAKPTTDSTFMKECRAMIHFNDACNSEIMIDTEAMTASVQVIDHITGKVYRGIADLQEVA